MTMASPSVSPRRFIAGEALEAHRFVKMSGSTENTVVYADAGDRAIGVTLVAAASGDQVAVELMNQGGTFKVIAAGTITVNSTVYTANDGKVSDSVQGNAIGILLKAGVANEPSELLAFAHSGGSADTDLVRYTDDFFNYVTGDFWTLDANDGGAFLPQDAHGGVYSLSASDTTDADNDESYLLSTNEVYKPAAGKTAIFKARVKLAEGNTDDANIVFGLTSTGIDAENLIVDNGATLEDANTHILINKADGGTVWKGVVRDSALDVDTNIGAFVTDTWYELMIVVSSAAGATDATVEFFINGVSGGTKPFTLSNATEMRVVFGVKNGGTGAPAGGEVLQIDKFYMEFPRS